METEDDLIVLSSGAVLKLGSPSPLALKDAMAQLQEDHPEPQPPEVWIEDKERDEPNASDPDYIRAHMLWQVAGIDRTINVLIVTGTTEHTRPEGMPGAEEEEFTDDLEIMGIRPAKTKRGRYLQWVKYRAMADQEDLKNLTQTLTRRVGATEEDIREAERLFRGLKEQSTNNRAPAAGPGGNRDRVRKRPARARS